MRISDWSSDVCSSDLRLWEAAATSGMPPYDPPEILERDLSTLPLDCAQWGVADPAQLKWIDPPPAAAVQEARVRLQSLEALDDDDRNTAHGKAISRLPLELRLAHMLVRAGARDLGWMAAEVAEHGRASRRERVCQYM